eukprot:COSAG03_NODE_24786_length_270_cov_0.497076_1_plen_62_part_10
MEEENAEKMKALKHLTKMNKKYATMKAPQLRKEPEKRGLFFKQKTAYEIRIRDWSSDVCSSD